MNKSRFRFTFQPATNAQRELIHHWLQQDYIREWIHGQGLQNTLVGLEKFLKYQTQNTIPTDITHHWIGYDNDIPFVYLLTSNVNPDDEYAKYSAVNSSAITLDIFIGDLKYVGKGLAARIIKEFLLNHFKSIEEVFIDPEKNNTRAVHVYQKVGFKVVGEFLASWHPVPHYIMQLNMKTLFNK